MSHALLGIGALWLSCSSLTPLLLLPYSSLTPLSWARLPLSADATWLSPHPDANLVTTPPRRFWGNQLRHFTQPNDTNSTRVSFDLRCVPLSLFVHDWKVGGK